jgi:hypothetical protein
VKRTSIVGRDYAAFVTELKTRIQSARLSAARAVNRDLILLYWDIGRAIVEKQEQLGWGESVIERLSHDLQETFPGVSGFSPRNLRSMRQLYAAYADPSIWLQLVAGLTKPVVEGRDAVWLQPVAKLDDTEQRIEFLRQAVAEIPWGQHLQSTLPVNLKGKLPTARQLSEAVRSALPGKSSQ